MKNLIFFRPWKLQIRWLFFSDKKVDIFWILLSKLEKSKILLKSVKYLQKSVKRDHAGEELFVNGLRLPVHQFPAEEVRVFHLTQAKRKHDPSLMKTKQGLADTIKKQWEKENAKFRNTWLLEPLWVILVPPCDLCHDYRRMYFQCTFLEHNTITVTHYTL